MTLRGIMAFHIHMYYSVICCWFYFCDPTSVTALFVRIEIPQGGWKSSYLSPDGLSGSLRLSGSLTLAFLFLQATEEVDLFVILMVTDKVLDGPTRDVFPLWTFARLVNGKVLYHLQGCRGHWCCSLIISRSYRCSKGFGHWRVLCNLWCYRAH